MVYGHDVGARGHHCDCVFGRFVLLTPFFSHSAQYSNQRELLLRSITFFEQANRTAPLCGAFPRRHRSRRVTMPAFLFSTCSTLVRTSRASRGAPNVRLAQQFYCTVPQACFFFAHDDLAVLHIFRSWRLWHSLADSHWRLAACCSDWYGAPTTVPVWSHSWTTPFICGNSTLPALAFR